MFHKGPPGFVGAIKKQGLTKLNTFELRKYELVPYYRTREFRKRIAQLYVPIITQHADASNGRFPVFKVSKTAIDALVKKANNGSASSTQRPKKANPVRTNNHINNGSSFNRVNQNQGTSSLRKGAPYN